MVERDGKAVYLDKAIGDHAIQTYARVGTYSHLHCLASGKAILANLPEERVEEIITAHGLPAKTENTLTTREELFDELGEIRDQGYAINNSEAISGSRSIGAPVIVEDEVHGAVCVSGPANRISIPQMEDEIVKNVLSAANEIELKIAQRFN
jgi:DNA-binding IclR family transcriptional regulator